MKPETGADKLPVTSFTKVYLFIFLITLLPWAAAGLFMDPWLLLQGALMLVLTFLWTIRWKKQFDRTKIRTNEEEQMFKFRKDETRELDKAALRRKMAEKGAGKRNQ